MSGSRLLFIFTFLWLVSCKKTEENPDLSASFIKLYGSGNGQVSGNVRQTPDGGYILIGTKFTQAATSSSDILLIKTDANGNEEWQRLYGGSGPDFGEDVLLASDGGYYVLGTLTRTDTLQFPNRNIYLLKLNGNGDTVWTRNIGGENSGEFGKAFIRDINGTFYIAGETDSTVNRDKNYYFVKLENKDSEAITNIFGFSSANENETVGNLIRNKNGQFSFVGFAAGADSTPQVIELSDNLTTSNARDKAAFQEPGLRTGADIVQTQDGGFVIVGTTRGQGSSGSQIYLLGMNASFQKIWFATFGDAGEGFGRSLKPLADGGFIVAGEITRTGKETDIYLFRTDSRGNKIWENSFGGTGPDKARRVQLTTDGGFIISGIIRLETVDMMCLIKTDSEGKIKP